MICDEIVVTKRRENAFTKAKRQASKPHSQYSKQKIQIGFESYVDVHQVVSKLTEQKANYRIKFR